MPRSFMTTKLTSSTKLTRRFEERTQRRVAFE